ncbi:MAG: hypothetical protein ACLU6O_01240 [Bilophila wadsworthia]
MTQKKTPTGLNRQGQQKKSRTDREENTRFPLAGQGFCAPCPYFRAVKLASGRVRRVCSFHGVRVGVYGVPGCEFMKPEGGNDAA